MPAQKRRPTGTGASRWARCVHQEPCQIRRDAPVLFLKGAPRNNPFAPALYSLEDRPMTFVTAFQYADTFAFGQGQQGGADLRAGPG